MSMPIDIPRAEPFRTRHEIEPFPVEDGPYFGYIEISENGTVVWAVSSGNGKFVEIGSRRNLPALAFIVEKDRTSRSITIEITSLELKQSLYRAFLNYAPSSASSNLEFDTLLRNYDALKVHLERAESRHPHAQATAELTLLVSDLLLERRLYDGIGMEGFRQRQVLCATHLQDIHQHHIDLGLDEIQDCFALGLLPDEINQEYMEALNVKYAELARAGDFYGLQNLCEPIVRSGEIELKYNPSLLLEVLDHGDLELYQYMLALVDRTREDIGDGSEEDISDITFDPFHVAIRLGQVELVQSFVRNNAYFEGRASDCSMISNSQLLTPLTSAVCWRQPGIVRLLLKCGPLYTSSYPQAVAMALNSELQDMLAILSEFSTQSNPTTEPWYFLPSESFSVAMSSDELSPFCPEVDTPEHPAEIPSMSILAISAELDIGTAPSIDSAFAQNDIDPQKLLSPTTEEPIQLTLLDPPDVTRTTVENSHSVISTNDIRKPTTETTSPIEPFMSQTPSHCARRKAGQGFIQRLGTQFVKFRNLCQERHEQEEYTRLLRCFTGLEYVWDTGIRVFRGIYRNRTPENLVEVICCLLVADAISVRMSLHDSDLCTQFVQDLARWRSIVNDAEKEIFDEVAEAIWNVSETHQTFATNDEVYEMEKFQHIMQELVSIDNVDRHLGYRPSRRGARLQTLYDRKGKRKQEPQHYQPGPTPGPWDPDDFPYLNSMPEHFADTLSPTEEHSINLGDFIYLDGLDIDDTDIGTMHSPRHSPRPIWEGAWKKIKPTVALLLASVAFSFVLSLLSSGDDLASGVVDVLAQTSPNPGCRWTSLEEFSKFEEPSTPAFQGIHNRRITNSSQQSLRISMMQQSARKPARQAFSRHVITSPSRPRARRRSVLGSTASPGSSSFMSTDLSSTDTAQSPERMRCLSPGCIKTFSSVSNRNKHMREGCALRDKRGYPCRNASCVKILTTKWYRNTHEQTRCRFR